MSKWDNLETGIFYNRRSADHAVARLCELGYTLEDVNVLMSENTRAEEFADVTSHKAAEGALAGALVGGGLSAVVASLAATGSIAAIAASGGAATPLVAGPLAAALAALGVGGGAGGILGALIGVGVTDAQAKKYEDALKKGAIIIGVRPRPDDQDRVKHILSESEGVSDFAETGGGVRRH